MPKGVPCKRYIAEFEMLVVEIMQQERLGCTETANCLNFNAAFSQQAG